MHKYLNKLPDPPLHPVTKKPVEKDDLEAIFPTSLIAQEMSLQKKIQIPDQVRDIFAMYRPTPMIRAKRLEKFLDTPAHIYFKYEGATLTGSHKINTAITQAYYNKQEGVSNLITETGAGQWGSALSLACRFFGLNCLVFMVKVSFEQKPYRKFVMETYGAKVIASPSIETDFGKEYLSENPQSPGSLGIAISEALEKASTDSNSKYALGSVLNHVILHQTIIGQEAKKQMQKAGEEPDIIIGCVGGGSNFSGFAIPFIIDKIAGKRKKLRAIAVESINCPKMTKGKYKYDFGDTAKKTPLLKMETLGCNFVPPAIHAGGLRYHGNSPILSFLHQQKIVEAKAYDQKQVFQSAVDFARCEGIIPAPESSHAVKAVFDEAEKCKREKRKKVIVFNMSGHGLLDLAGYGKFLHNKL